MTTTANYNTNYADYIRAALSGNSDTSSEPEQLYVKVDENRNN
jgi:hypothetical protein